MWCRSYREHAIMPFPSFDAASKSWLCQANITWVCGSIRESAFVRFPGRVQTETAAVSTSLHAAQAWIDKRLQSISYHPASDALSTLRKSPSSRSKPLAVQSAKATVPLTFDRFKSMVKSDRRRDGEQSLQRSYTALLEWRRKGHRSWAQIAPKLRHLGDRAGGSRATKSARLPLTQGDWRRFIRNSIQN